MLELIERVVEAGRRRGIEVGLCGDMASDAQFAGPRLEGVADGADHLLGDGVGRGELDPLAPGLAVDADPHLHLVVAKLNVGPPAAGTVQLVSATPIDPVAPLTHPYRRPDRP